MHAVMYIILAYLVLLGPYMMMHQNHYPEYMVKTTMMMSMVIVATSVLMIMFSVLYGVILFFWR